LTSGRSGTQAVCAFEQDDKAQSALIAALKINTIKVKFSQYTQHIYRITNKTF